MFTGSKIYLCGLGMGVLFQIFYVNTLFKITMHCDEHWKNVTACVLNESEYTEGERGEEIW